MTVAISNYEPTEGHIETRSTGHLVLQAEQSNWSDDQRAALQHLGLTEATESDLKVFLHYCQRTGLDPFSKQIYMIKRWSPEGDKWTIQAAIEGLRLVGERHDQYAGQTEPEWCGEDGVWRDVWLGTGHPVAARVKVMRRDWDLPASGTVLFTEFAQTKRNGDLTSMWAGKPAHMLAKCAEAAALRKAFPNDLSGVYTPEEMGGLDGPGGGRSRMVVNHTEPVTTDEIRGVTAAPATAGDEVVAPPTDKVADKMTQGQQRKIFALLREQNIDDRNGWASGILVRDITSFGQLTQGDAARLIDDLESNSTTTEG